MTNITPDKLDQAREWASWLTVQEPQSKEIRAAAEVINALPDEWIDADKLREAIEFHRGRWPHGAEEDLESLLPAPTPRTMAEIKWDDDEHPYLEAVTVSGRRYIMLAPMGKTAVSDNTILAAERGGGLPVCVPAEGLTPAGRYARLVWPEENPTTEDTPEPAPDHPEDVPEGEVWMIRPYENADPTPAFRVHESKYGSGKRWAHYRVDGSTLGFADDEEVTLLHRLVPEPTPTQQERVVTEDDYRNAPSGTVVWGRGPSSGVLSSLEKYGNIWLEAGGEGTITPLGMERNGPHEVLRWGDVS